MNATTKWTYGWSCKDEGCKDEVVAIGMGRGGRMFAFCPGCLASQVNDQASGMIEEGDESFVAFWMGTHNLTDAALDEMFGKDR